MSTQLAQIAAKAKADRTLRFTSLAHLLTPAFLIETWRQMNRRGASGVDGETTTEFERELETRVQDICARLKAGTCIRCRSPCRFSLSVLLTQGIDRHILISICAESLYSFRRSCSRG